MQQNCIELQRTTIIVLELEFHFIRKLFTVDYSRDTGGINNAFIAEVSFSVLDWLILDKSRKSGQFTLKDIDNEQ